MIPAEKVRTRISKLLQKIGCSRFVICIGDPDLPTWYSNNSDDAWSLGAIELLKQEIIRRDAPHSE